MSWLDGGSDAVSGTPCDEVLARTVHEQVDLRRVLDIADRSARGRGGDYAMAVALQLLDRLLTDELIRIGDVTDTGFTPWHMPTDSILIRIRATWLSSDCRVRPGDVCWIEATSRGRLIGQEVLERCDIIDARPLGSVDSHAGASPTGRRWRQAT